MSARNTTSHKIEPKLKWNYTVNNVEWNGADVHHKIVFTQHKKTSKLLVFVWGNKVSEKMVSK